MQTMTFDAATLDLSPDQVFLTSLVGAYLDRLQRDGIDAPLGATFTLGAVLCDLFDLAGAPVPPDIAAVVGRTG